MILVAASLALLCPSLRVRERQWRSMEIEMEICPACTGKPCCRHDSPPDASVHPGTIKLQWKAGHCWWWKVKEREEGRDCTIGLVTEMALAFHTLRALRFPQLFPTPSSVVSGIITAILARGYSDAVHGSRPHLRSTRFSTFKRLFYVPFRSRPLNKFLSARSPLTVDDAHNTIISHVENLGGLRLNALPIEIRSCPWEAPNCNHSHHKSLYFASPDHFHQGPSR